MTRHTLVPFVALIALGSAASSAAQSSRTALIQQHRSQLSDAVSMRLLFSALDPALGAPDSAWAVAGYDLADRLIELGQRSLASFWLRWIARHGAEWPVDRDWYLPPLVEAYERAVSAVEAGRESGYARTRWRWPTAYDGRSRGSVVATASGAGPVTLAVEGREQSASAEALSLSPGTYVLIASAEGYEPARLVREILPGVTTVLDIDLVSLLPSEVRQSVAEKLVRITYDQGGQEVCRNGVIAGSDGLVLTTWSSVSDGTSLRVAAFNGRQTFADVSVVATDPERDLAVLELNARRAPRIQAGTPVAEGQHAWSVHFSGCGDLTSAWTRLTGWQSPPTSQAEVTSPIPVAAVGAPLIDRSGSLLGLVLGSRTVVPAALTEDVLERAHREIAGQVSPLRRIPWKWVGAGAVAVGLAFVLVG